MWWVIGIFLYLGFGAVFAGSVTARYPERKIAGRMFLGCLILWPFLFIAAVTEMLCGKKP